ncbi:spore coat protein GerQ [Evansella sp. AB-rgal1]|uniref:spore coat protein GerQ n=1 Tax=Evansella sp. AB-rgal1 TaxID=3242696 RepID=UPI00359EF2A5
MYSQSGYPYSPYGYGYGTQGTPGMAQTPTPGFVQQQPTTPAPPPQAPGQLPLEQSFIENILRLNRGKIGTFYMTFEYNERWNAKVFKGVVEAAGRDHIIISDPQTGKRYLLLMVNLDYVTFDEEIKYDYDWPGAAAAPDLDTYPPR